MFQTSKRAFQTQKVISVVNTFLVFIANHIELKFKKNKIMKHGIVIPCYNEENRLNTQKFVNFIQSHPDYLLCFVNDGSKDNTAAVLESMTLHNPLRIHVLDLKVNVGKGEAVRQGFQYLYKSTDVDTIGYLDADLATGFDDYVRLTNEFIDDSQELNMVFASRKLNETEGSIQRNGMRKIVSNIIGLAIAMIVRMNVKDTQCGAKVFKRSLVPMIFNESFVSRWLFDVELFVRLRKIFGREVAMSTSKEVMLNAWEDVEGSKITLRDSLKFPAQLAQITSRYEIKPMYSYAAASVASAWGFIAETSY